MAAAARAIFGPRVPGRELAMHRARYTVPTVLLLAATILLLFSFYQPYWNMTLHAPQYPQGLTVHAFLSHLEGDVHEIDGLNHYIGMRPLNEAAQLERSLAWISIAAIGLLAVAAAYIHSPWAALVALPALLFPGIFILDMYYWLHDFGQNLDPHAALSNAVKPFTPPVLGVGKIGQFRTVAAADVGLYMALGASLLVITALYFHRRAYKPLFVEEMKKPSEAAEQPSPKERTA